MFQCLGNKENGKGFTLRIMLLLVLGVFLMLGSSFCSRLREEKSYSAAETPLIPPAVEDEKDVRELRAMLEQIRGVGTVSLFLTYESMGRFEPVTDGDETVRRTVEEDGSGGSREILEETRRETYVILRDLQGKENPLIVEERKPRFRGVLVVAEGAEDPAVKAMLVEALRAVLDLPAHRITVLPRW